MSASSLAFCWRIERRDGAGLGLTSHDRALMIDGDLYRPAPGMTPASVKIGAGLDPQSSEVEGALSDAALCEGDFLAGRWDGARMALLAADWSDAAAVPLRLTGGGIGPVTIRDGKFAAELVGAAAGLDAPLCPETSPECRAELGDPLCRVDLAGRRAWAVVAHQGGNVVTLDVPAETRFLFGEACVIDGAAAGWRSPVIGIDGAQLMLRDAPPGGIASGVRLRLTEGCDKRFATCAARFANSLNFRGEPHLPGNDLLTRYPGA